MKMGSKLGSTIFSIKKKIFNDPYNNDDGDGDGDGDGDDELARKTKNDKLKEDFYKSEHTASINAKKQERLAKEKQEHLAKEIQDRLAKEIQDRLAKEKQERLAKEEQDKRVALCTVDIKDDIRDNIETVSYMNPYGLDLEGFLKCFRVFDIIAVAGDDFSTINGCINKLSAVSDEYIKRIYHQKAKHCHTDKSQTESTKLQFQILTEANKALIAAKEIIE